MVIYDGNQIMDHRDYTCICIVYIESCDKSWFLAHVSKDLTMMTFNVTYP